MFFGNLRETEWNPTFEWVETNLECADKINSYHEDYPKYVEVTKSVLEKVGTGNWILSPQLQAIHQLIFSDQPWAGTWRQVDVRIGLHHPPSVNQVEELMLKLEELYIISDIETLIEWYKDFETIHPFQDGNGRVGGVIVATYAHSLLPDKGWLAPNQ